MYLPPLAVNKHQWVTLTQRNERRALHGEVVPRSHASAAVQCILKQAYVRFRHSEQQHANDDGEDISDDTWRMMWVKS